MDPKISKKLCSVFNTLLLSTAGAVAQDGDFYKQMLKETMKETMKDVIKPLTAKKDPLKNNVDRKTIELEIDPKNIKIPLYTSFNYSRDSLKNAVMSNMTEEDKYAISPYFFMPFTNEDLPFDYYYDDTPVFIDGKWIPASALPGGGIGPMTIINFLFSSGIVKYDPLPPTKSRKEKALERLREVYGSGMEDGKWDGDAKKLNAAINKLRDEMANEIEREKEVQKDEKGK
ncbi:MAG: hypothetical protein LBJ72_00210 [Dysgonamonadaceae bacterium]|jgi:hypothetical protein|nr:hypothetical protein [Dysgonamonadaceae bacterium]